MNRCICSFVSCAGLLFVLNGCDGGTKSVVEPYETGSSEVQITAPSGPNLMMGDDCPHCTLKNPTSSQRTKYRNAALQIDRSVCGAVYDKAMDLEPGYKVWDEEWRYNGLLIVGWYEGNTRMYKNAHDRSDFPTTVAHEAIHALNPSWSEEAVENEAAFCTPGN